MNQHRTATGLLVEQRQMLHYAQVYLQHVRVGNHRDLWVAAENRVKRELDALWKEQERLRTRVKRRIPG